MVNMPTVAGERGPPGGGDIDIAGRFRLCIAVLETISFLPDVLEGLRCDRFNTAVRRRNTALIINTGIIFVEYIYLYQRAKTGPPGTSDMGSSWQVHRGPKYPRYGTRLPPTYTYSLARNRAIPQSCTPNATDTLARGTA